MPELSSSGPRRHNRAKWVALRTLRQLPKVVGETSAGEPIVEIRSVRLVLRDGAGHFSRLTTCSKCDQQVPAAPVRSPGDLHHSPHAVICRDCVRTASAPVLSNGHAPVDRDPEAAGSRNGAAGGDDARVAALERQVAELVNGQRAGLEAALEGRVEETRVEVRSFAAKELARAQEDVDRMMKGVLERVGRTASGDGGGASAVEAELTLTIERLAQQVDAQRTELVADLEGRLAGLQASVEDHAGRKSAEIQALKAELADARDDLRRRIEAMAVPAGSDDTAAGVDAVETQGRELEAGFEGRAAPVQSGPDERPDRLAEQARPERERLARVEARLPELQATVEEARDAAAGVEERLVERAESAAADAKRVEALDEQLGQLDERLDRSRAEAAALEAAVNERLDRHAERLTRTVAVVPRLDALGKHLDDAVGRLTALVQSKRRELQEDVRRGLDEVRAALASVEKGNDGRLRDVETVAAQRASQLEDLVELQTALDTGLGELRSQIQEVRETATRAAYLDAVDMPQLPPMETERGRRGGKKAVEAVAGLSAALQALLRDQRQLRAEVLTLGNESQTAVRASARASARAAAVAPLRQDVRGLRDEVVAQNEAVAALAKTVESLRRAVQPMPAAKPAARRAEAAPAPKATNVTILATRTPAANATKMTKKA